jgi:PAP2 superfamily protein
MAMLSFQVTWREAAIASLCALVVAALAAVASQRAGGPRWGRVAKIAWEAGLLLGLYALWQFAGSLSDASPLGAVRRAEWIWHFERAIALPSETAVQRVFLPHPLVVQALNLYYAVLHFPVLIGCLIWLFIRHRGRYWQVRTTVVLFTAGALLIQLIPVAPPRLLPRDGMIDTALHYGQSVYGPNTGIDADQLSAMPSVHVGWALLVAVVVVTTARSRWRWLALAYPALTVLAVTVTANHFWLDGIAAAALLALVLIAQRAARAARVPAPSPEPEPAPQPEPARQAASQPRPSPRRGRPGAAQATLHRPAPAVAQGDRASRAVGDQDVDIGAGEPPRQRLVAVHGPDHRLDPACPAFGEDAGAGLPVVNHGPVRAAGQHAVQPGEPGHAQPPDGESRRLGRVTADREPDRHVREPALQRGRHGAVSCRHDDTGRAE